MFFGAGCKKEVREEFWRAITNVCSHVNIQVMEFLNIFFSNENLRGLVRKTKFLQCLYQWGQKLKSLSVWDFSKQTCLRDAREGEWVTMTVSFLDGFTHHSPNSTADAKTTPQGLILSKDLYCFCKYKLMRGKHYFCADAELFWLCFGNFHT